jgi:hypothetical protein
VFSLKTTELNVSWIAFGLWLFWVMVGLALLQLFWMPAFWRALLYLGVGGIGVAVLLHLFRQSSPQVGIDEQGAFILVRGQYKKLQFIRINAVQLIAKQPRESRLLDRFWPSYRVIYRDSLNEQAYRTLRSFAAQQMLLHRSEEARKRYRSTD